MNGDSQTLLDRLGKSRIFKAIQSECEQISNEIGEIDVYLQDINVLSEGIDLDEDVVDFIPTDLISDVLLPCQVNADGNCLPSTGSISAFAHRHQVHEIRLRIIMEQVKHEQYYLNDSFLEHGQYSRNGKSKSSLKIFRVLHPRRSLKQ